MKALFRQIAQQASHAMGSPWAFVLALMVIVAWAASGPLFHYSDTWQLAINTGTTIVTFLMVFLIQNTQNRDARVVHLKLDELIRAITTARTELVAMEHLSDEELERLQGQFERLHQHATEHRARRSRRPRATEAEVNGVAAKAPPRGSGQPGGRSSSKG
jgi:low affinity Fe/Cu permease